MDFDMQFVFHNLTGYCIIPRLGALIGLKLEFFVTCCKDVSTCLIGTALNTRLLSQNGFDVY